MKRATKLTDEYGNSVEVTNRFAGGCYIRCSSPHAGSCHATLTARHARRLAAGLLKFADGASKPKRKGKA